MSQQPSPRVAMVVPYWTFWEASAGGPALRDERERVAAEAGRLLTSTGAVVVWQGLVDGAEAGVAAVAAIEAADPDVVVVLQTMAVPPAYAKATLDGLGPRRPVVVWAFQTMSTIRVGYDESDITTLGATVGTPMLTNVLAREGRPHALVVGHPDADTSDLSAAVWAATVARRIATGRLLRVGSPLDGYACVDVDAEALTAATGLSVADVTAADVAARYRAVPPELVETLLAEARSTFTMAQDLNTEGLRRALALAAALESLDDETGAVAGAMNSHVPELRFAEDPGINLGYALGRETTRGVPWTDVGDAVTAVAMAVGKGLAGAVLYHEIEAFDPATDEVVLANSGEHDLHWHRSDTPPLLVTNRWYAGDPLTGPAVWFELPKGPATLIAFTPDAREPSGFRFVAAEGSITDRSLPRAPTVGGAFRFSGDRPVAEAWKAWALAGANHHSGACPGLLADRVAMVADHLGVGFVRV